MKKNIIFILFICIVSACSNQKALDAKAKHQAESGNRINESQKNTDGLFKEMDK